MTTHRAKSIVPALVLTVLALSGCGAKDAQKEATPSPSSTSASSASATVAKPVGDKVAPPDLPAVVTNRTHRGSWEGKPYAEYYVPDGTLRGKIGDEAYTGSWKVVGEQLCFTYPDKGRASEIDCYAVFKNGDVVSWVASDGKVVETTFAEGNPDNL